MFTGIIQAIGTLSSMERYGPDLRLRINTGKLWRDDVELGDSIYTNGVCLTVAALPGDGYIATVRHTPLVEILSPNATSSSQSFPVLMRRRISGPYRSIDESVPMACMIPVNIGLT